MFTQHPVQDKEPILILKNGLYIQDFANDYTGSPSWSRYFAQAKDLLKESQCSLTSNEKLIEQLYLTLDSQSMYDCRFVYPFEIIDKETTREGKSIRMRVRLHTEFEHPKYGQIKNASISELEDEMIKENQYDCELSNYNNPYDDFSDDQRWRVVLFDRNILTLEKKKWKPGETMPPPNKGFLRPWSYKLSLSLFRRKKIAITTLKGNRFLQDVILFPGFLSIFPESERIYNSNLANRILYSHPIFLVQGPPGTGKTWLASEVISNILKADPAARILVTAKDHEPLNHLMNIVNNNIQENPISPHPLMVRHFSPDKEQDIQKIDIVYPFLVQNVLRDIINKSIDRCNRSSLPQDLRDRWISYLDSESEAPSRSIMDLVQKSANVFFTTSTSSVMRWLDFESPPFDWVIIEEAGKSYPTELLIPMLLGHKWLLIGDQKQLPPYKHREIANIINRFVSQDKAFFTDWSNEEFALFKDDLMEKVKFFNFIFDTNKKASYLYLPRKFKPPVERLEDQYRMPPTISDMISGIFYNTEFIHKKESPNPGDPFNKPDILVNREIVS